MLVIVIPGQEFFDEKKQEFIRIGDETLELEHSLLSVSKWESEFEKPFFSKEPKTSEEILGYIRCMILTPDISPDVLKRLTTENYNKINEYIEAKHTATWFHELDSSKQSSEMITSELVYYWMSALNISFECDKWNLSRLFTLLRICSIKNSKPKKMPRSEISRRNRELNAQRKAQLGTSG